METILKFEGAQKAIKARWRLGRVFNPKQTTTLVVPFHSDNLADITFDLHAKPPGFAMIDLSILLPETFQNRNAGIGNRLPFGILSRGYPLRSCLASRFNYLDCFSPETFK